MPLQPSIFTKGPKTTATTLMERTDVEEVRLTMIQVGPIEPSRPLLEEIPRGEKPIKITAFS